MALKKRKMNSEGCRRHGFQKVRVLSFRKRGYTDYSKTVEEKKGEAFVEKPYVISPEEFGTMKSMKKISLTYYADEVLADENDEEVERCGGNCR